MKEGWTPEVLKQEVDQCTNDYVQQGTDAVLSNKYCQCLGDGISKKYTFAEFDADRQTVGADAEVIQSCAAVAQGG